MITNEMRKTLTEDLQYQPEEVNDMEPQVAAGVIRTLNMKRNANDDEERVDMDAFLRVQRLTLWDRLVLRVNRLVYRKHERFRFMS
eukprot:gene24391-30735_t